MNVLRRHGAASRALRGIRSKGPSRFDRKIFASFQIGDVRAFSKAKELDGDRPDPDAILRPVAPVDAKKQFSLHHELPGLPKLKPASQLQAPHTEVTVLPSGLRVISQETYGQAATLGLFIDAGSRYEVESNVGVSHMLEHLGFKSSTTRSHAELVREVENIGALTTASCGREQIIYTIDLLRDNAERGLSLLADSILNPLWTEEDVEITKNIMAIQTEDLFENPQALLQEYVHAAAYGSDAPLGRPLQCPIDKIGNLTLEKVQKFRQEYFVAPRMVVAGSGIEHETLVNLTKKYFDKVPSGAAGSKYQAPPIAQYKGGVQTIENKESPFSYATLAFPSGGWHHDDLVPVCVLHTLLGGGDSFSAGGPGKGMYSRLYTSVLNRFHWVESCFAFSSLHADVGLLGIYGACLPSHTPQLIMLLANQLLHIAYVDVNPIELARAKNQLKSSVLMNLESRMILYEDIGRQLLTYGQRESPESICEKIDQVTAADLKRIMQLAMESPPSVVYSGDLTRFPAYEEVANAIANSLKMAKQQQQQQ